MFMPEKLVVFANEKPNIAKKVKCAAFLNKNSPYSEIGKRLLNQCEEEPSIAEKVNISDIVKSVMISQTRKCFRCISSMFFLSFLNYGNPTFFKMFAVLGRVINLKVGCCRPFIAR